ncbi:cytochrome (ubi)quinol oxidase subunit III [Halothiobacillus sp.]|uniref:cytochrome (ubi)quinol oxidase subunit III n=1 Tax=Halothiobacillus sp. TaxID=1891311 RepID=UPI002AD519EB|nr:cytochrome (ubi)quinol oxidase subunit III [Halothiobacillus sp.]
MSAGNVNTEALKHPGINLGEAHGEAHTQAEGVVFGFWVFLMSDFILFGLLFATYATMVDHTAGGPGPKALFDLKSISIETFALLLSSFTFGMASLNLKHGERRKPIILWLLATLMLGLIFLGLELHDFSSMIDKGAGPWRSGFLSAFFGLVPLHGLHVATASLWLIVMLVQMGVFGLTPRVKTRLLRLGLFWHFLDIIWVGIFSIVYLAGLS